MNQDTRPIDAMLDEYAEWLRTNSSVRKIQRWTEITVPFLDHSGDHFQFYVRERDGILEFTDDGYVLNGMETSGFPLREKRVTRVSEIAGLFGASYNDGAIVMTSAPDKSADSLNRYVQAIVRIDSLMETVEHRVAAYFSEDVAAALSSQCIFYTRDVSIQGKSLLDHTFDFLFQESERHPTYFAEAPNRLDQTALATILFAWNDVSGDKRRRDARLLIFADDREKTIGSGILSGFEQYQVQVMKYSEIPEKARPILAA